MNAEAIAFTEFLLFLPVFNFSVPQIVPEGDTSLLSCLPESSASAHYLYCTLLYFSLCSSLSSFTKASTMLAPCRKAGREPGIFHHVLRDVGCVVWCVVLLSELRVTLIVVDVVRAVSR